MSTSIQIRIFTVCTVFVHIEMCLWVLTTAHEIAIGSYVKFTYNRRATAKNKSPMLMDQQL